MLRIISCLLSLSLTGCHSLIVVNDKSRGTSYSSAQSRVTHYLVGALSADSSVKSPCIQNWQKIEIRRNPGHFVASTGLDIFIFSAATASFTGGVIMGTLGQGTLGSPTIYKSTDVIVSCSDFVNESIK